MIRADVCGVWGHEYRRCLGRMNTGAGHSPIPQMWRRGAWLHPHSASLALIRNILGQNFSSDVVYASQSASEMLCVSWGIEWCWRSPGPFKQGKGNSFADSGGLKLEAAGQGLHPKQRDLLSESQGCPRFFVQLSSESQLSGQPRTVGNFQAWKNPSASTRSGLVPLEIWICAGCWSFSILPKYLSSILVLAGTKLPRGCGGLPPIIIFSSISTVANWITQPINDGPDFFFKCALSFWVVWEHPMGMISYVQFTTS